MRLLFLAIFVLIFAACQVPPNIDIGGAVRDGVKAGVEAADRNRDGVLTNQEIKDSKNDPSFWLAIAGGLLGLLGWNTSRKAQRDTDDLYDKVEAKKPA